ncbi:MAG: winged helix-turn-helix domain-containing protein [Acidimicrobiia bacterium]|jgi:DNA-binding transcriptional ArsR family regulator
MKVSGPPLLPILRSENQARLLTAILLSPEREFTLSELANEVGVSLSTVTREIQRASEAGLVVTREVGRAKVVSADTDSVLSEPLTRLLLLSFGPVVVVAEELAGIGGIEAAYIFGSWAARYVGQAGPSPQDLDVLIIGTPDRDVVYAAADRIERRVGRPAQVTFRSLNRWNEPGEDSFLQEVRKRPLIPVGLPETESD